MTRHDAGLWRRWVLIPLARGAAGLPLALVAPLLAMVGLGGPVARLQLRLTRSPVRHAADPGLLRTVGHSLMVIPPALVAFAATALTGFVAYSGYLYPIRPDVITALGHPLTVDPALGNAWGGPTLVGAWLAHTGVALAIQVLALPVIHAGNALHGWFTEVWLGPAARSGHAALD